MAAKLVERGFGQVEPNRLSGITYGDIEAQAPAYESNAGTTKITQLENGQFLCVVRDAQGVAPLGRVAVYPAKAITLATPFLVFSERKQYDEREMYCDFVDRAADKVDGTLYPRLIGLKAGADVFTTNTVNEVTADVSAGDVLYIGPTGYLVKADDNSSPTNIYNTVFQFRVDKKYTMPDGQVGVKLSVENYGA